jgi:Glycosyltransferase family 87
MLQSSSFFAVRLRLSTTGLRVLESAPWVGIAVAGLAWVAVVGFAEPFGRLWGTGQDARCYWLPSLLDPYAQSEWTNPIAYVYSPAFLQLVSPLTRLPWQAFMGAWTAILLLAVRFLTGSRLLAAGIAFAAMEIAGGNISLLLAVAIVLGFRWPAAWAFVLLTKVTPGVGLLWFAVRREWRSLAMALGATLAVVVGSGVLLPGAWSEWIDVLTRNGSRDGTWAALPIALWIRLPIAIGIVVWGARTNRRWAVPVASLIALPAVWYGSLSMLLAIVALRETARSDDAERNRDSDAELRRTRRNPEPSPAGA